MKKASAEDLRALELLFRHLYDQVASGLLPLVRLKEALQPLLETLAQVPAKPPTPVVGRIFNLTYDFGPNPKPEKIPNSIGYTNSWKFHGHVLVGMQTGRFKWVTIGPQPNLEAVRSVLTKYHGPVPDGQWLMAIGNRFCSTEWYGIADGTWENSNDHTFNFPVITAGRIGFCNAEKSLSRAFHWLVEV